MSGLIRLFREPLIQFFLIGGLLFGVYATVAPASPPPAQIIDIGPERLQLLRTGFESTWSRPPTDKEMAGLAEQYLRDEIYYREALALGLDRDDIVVRQRLRQKMEFISEAAGERRAPTDAALQAWLAAHPEDYRRDAQIALQQVFLGEDPARADVDRVLESLRAAPDTRFAALGRRSMLPAQVGLSPSLAVDRVFGRGFSGLLREVPLGVWSGPVNSGYGVHLVRITEAVPGRLPALAEVRDAVARDWSAARDAEARQAIFDRLRSRYAVKIAETPSPDVARQ
jgi:hypothetical protein